MKKPTLLLLCAVVAIAFNVPSFAACGNSGLTEAGFVTGTAGTTVYNFQQGISGCNFFVTMVYLKAANISTAAAATVVVNMYDNLNPGVGCTGNIKASWTLTTGTAHGSSDLIYVNFPGNGLVQGTAPYTCISMAGATGIVSTLGFSGVFQ